MASASTSPVGAAEPQQSSAASQQWRSAPAVPPVRPSPMLSPSGAPPRDYAAPGHPPTPSRYGGLYDKVAAACTNGGFPAERAMSYGADGVHGAAHHSSNGEAYAHHTAVDSRGLPMAPVGADDDPAEESTDIDERSSLSSLPLEGRGRNCV
eukprot:7378731-Prymnesium_polylepis.1